MINDQRMGYRFLEIHWLLLSFCYIINTNNSKHKRKSNEKKEEIVRNQRCEQWKEKDVSIHMFGQSFPFTQEKK